MLKPAHRRVTASRISEYFDEHIMSVHLKAGCVAMAKKGRPGEVEYQPIGDVTLDEDEVRAIAHEVIDAVETTAESFLEIEKDGCQVVQLGNMRITIAHPPFSDGWEITAVRPVARLTIDDYDLDGQVLERVEGQSRGVLIAGPPGSGKSTLAAAFADHLASLDRVVKTMERPRDLQVPQTITQYGALEGQMEGTGEIMLLVRPDHVIYDEVRTTNDFAVFADMRLAGIGLLGVTHGNRAIDAVQRLVGRVELGVIPQIVDTILHVDAGEIVQTLELALTVKVPQGMVQQDLARPVVIVTELGGEPLFEIYTYGEQVVVMPLDQVNSPGDVSVDKIVTVLRRYVRGKMDVSVRGGTATVVVNDAEVPTLIGRGGATVQSLENRLGIRLDIQGGNPVGSRPLAPERGRKGGKATKHGDRKDRGPLVKRTGSNVFVVLDRYDAGDRYEVRVGDATVAEATISQAGKLRFKANSPEGKAIEAAAKSGFEVAVRRAR